MTPAVQKRLGKIINFVYVAIILGLSYLFIKYCMGAVFPFIIAFFIAMIVQKPTNRCYKKIGKGKKIISTAFVMLVYLILAGLVSLLGAKIVTSISDFVSFLTEKINDFPTFVENIENSVEAGSMIYQLPYHEYPEYGPVNDMWDYHLFVGYLHSDKLKWSYGSVKGREGDSWNEEIGSLKADDMVKALKEAGFAGIYIDRRAYLAEQIEQLESDLTEATGTKPVISDNGCLSFYKF